MCKALPNNAYECNGGAACLTGSIWGTGIYTSDSNIFKAAQHMGYLPGKFYRVNLPGLPGYKGTTANGITTAQYNLYGASYVLIKGSPPEEVVNVNKINQEKNEPKIIQDQLISQMKNLYVSQMKKYNENIYTLINKNQLSCSICMKHPRNYLTLPCAHAHYCQTCIKSVVQNKKCAICSQQVCGMMKINL